MLTPAGFTCVCSRISSHTQTKHVHGHQRGAASLSLRLYLCVVVLLSFLLLWEGAACLAAGTFPFLCWPVPRCICRGSSLSLQKAQRKKIRKLALMKTRSTARSLTLSLSLSLSLPPLFTPSSAMNLERRERRRIKVNSNQLCAAPDDRTLKCKCACVSFFTLLFSLSLSPALSAFFFFL